MLEEARKLDPENAIFPYEIALAHFYMKDYKKAIKELKKLLSHPDVDSQIYQLLGNTHSVSGNPKRAIQTYGEGLEKFPNSGNLYLERGNVHSYQEEYQEALRNYENGISVDPMFPSNYYRAAQIFLASTDIVPGLIYGEIFMNLERTTERTKEMSKLLYEAYDGAINIYEDSINIDFCEVIINIDPDTFDPEEDFKLPYCAIYAKSMAMAALGQKKINPGSLSVIRQVFLDLYYQEDAKEYPVILFDYHKKMIEVGIFDAYNHYLFQMSDIDRFNTWYSSYEKEFDEFVDWYTKPENLLSLNAENKYTRRN